MLSKFTVSSLVVILGLSVAWAPVSSASALAAQRVETRAEPTSAGHKRQGDGVSPSVRATLPAAAYGGLACDPFDPRLKKVAMANGVGPEARVADACMRLEWLSRAGTPTPPISVVASPTYPAPMVKRVTAGIAAGHRLFGRFADVASYSALASRDPAFSCARGAEITAGRLTYPQNIQSWQGAFNSGCSGSSYSASSWTSTILGPGGRDYFGWTLTDKDQNSHFRDRNVLGPMWFLGAVSHEFAHSIQMQRSMPATRGQESIGRWFGEGQAQYLGNTAAAYTIGPPTIRAAQLRQLKDVMKQERVQSIDLASMESDWRTNLVYPAGYFAYEWLVAHFGLDATFAWWNSWNTGCEQPGSSICWRQRAPELFGMTDAELIAKLNDYVNAQVKG